MLDNEMTHLPSDPDNGEDNSREKENAIAEVAKLLSVGVPGVDTTDLTVINKFKVERVKALGEVHLAKIQVSTVVKLYSQRLHAAQRIAQSRAEIMFVEVTKRLDIERTAILNELGLQADKDKIKLLMNYAVQVDELIKEINTLPLAEELSSLKAKIINAAHALFEKTYKDVMSDIGTLLEENSNRSQKENDIFDEKK